MAAPLPARSCPAHTQQLRTTTVVWPEATPLTPSSPARPPRTTRNAGLKPSGTSPPLASRTRRTAVPPEAARSSGMRRRRRPALAAARPPHHGPCRSREHTGLQPPKAARMPEGTMPCCALARRAATVADPRPLHRAAAPAVPAHRLPRDALASHHSGAATGTGPPLRACAHNVVAGRHSSMRHRRRASLPHEAPSLAAHPRAHRTARVKHNPDRLLAPAPPHMTAPLARPKHPSPCPPATSPTRMQFLCAPPPPGE